MVEFTRYVLVRVGSERIFLMLLEMNFAISTFHFHRKQYVQLNAINPLDASNELSISKRECLF